MAPLGVKASLFMTGMRCCQCSWTNSTFEERASAVEAALKAIRSRLGGGWSFRKKWGDGRSRDVGNVGVAAAGFFSHSFWPSF